MRSQFALASQQQSVAVAQAAPYQPKQHEAALPLAPNASGEAACRGRERAAPATVESATGGPANGSATVLLGQGQGHGVIDQLQRTVQSRSHRRRSAAARSMACDLLALSGAEDLQDFLACMILSECAYKKVELSKEALISTVSSFIGMFPPDWVTLEAVQSSRSDLPQHYLLATGGDALYVAFMGTKQPRDLVTDATFLHEAVWAEAVALASDKQSVPAAHSGFLQRARAINVEQLHELAAASGRRLVLCGHSLGGAVAKLSTLRLLRDMPQWPAPKLKCMCFATPAVGNAALADLVKNAGWGSHFKTYFLPEDQVMQQLMRFAQTKPKTSVPAAAGSSGGASSAQSSGAAREPRARRWSWPGALATAGSEQVAPEPSLSMVASMDAAEAAIEDILSSAPVGVADSAASTNPATRTGSGAACRATDSCVSQGDEAAPAPPAPPFNLGLAFALQQKRLFRAVEKLAGQARIPLPLPQAYFHTFGAQLLVHADRAYYSDQAQPRCPPVPAEASAAAQPGTAAATSTGTQDAGSSGNVSASPCPSHSVKGPFNYHRMVSHRLRVLSIIGAVLPEDQRAQHQARIAAATAATATAKPAKAAAAPAASSSAPAPSASGSTEASGAATPASSRSTPRPLAGRRAGASAPIRLQSEGVYPRICAQRAIARLPVHLDLEVDGGSQASGSPSSGGSGTSSGSGVPGRATGSSTGTGSVGDAQRGPGSKGKLLAGLWGKRSAEEQVTLLMEVDGHNLQYCHHAVARLTLGPSPSQGQGQDLSVALPTEVVRVVADPERVVHHALSVLQDRLHQVAGSIGRYISRTRLDKAAAAAAPSSKMLVRITLPRSAARQLASQACATPAPQPPASAASSHPASPPHAQHQACLTLHLKSHFHEASVAVSVQPYKAAVLGTSLTATTLLQAALLAPVPKLAPPRAAPGASNGAEAGAGAAGARGPGARLVEAATFAIATSSAAASWWTPQPLRWARRLWTPQAATTTPSSSLSGTSPLPPTAFAGTASQQQPQLSPESLGRSTAPTPSGRQAYADPQALERSPLTRTVSDLAHVVKAQSQLARTMSDAIRVVQEPLLGLAGAKRTPPARRFSMDGNMDAAKAVAYAAYGAACGGAVQPPPQQQQARALRALQPVAGLFLLVRFIQQATARIVATRVMGTAAAAAGSGAAQQAPMPAGAALLMRRRAASYAASVVMQQLEPQLRGSSSSSSSMDAQGRIPVAQGGWLPSGVRFLADFGRAPYLQLVGNVLRPRWAGIGSRAAQTASLLAQTLPLRAGGGRDASTACGSSGGGGVSRRRQGAWWGGIPWGLRRRSAAPSVPADGMVQARTLLAHASPLHFEEEEALLSHPSLLEAQPASAVRSTSASVDDTVADGQADVQASAASQPLLLQRTQAGTATLGSRRNEPTGEPAVSTAVGSAGGGKGDGVEVKGKRRSYNGLGSMRASTSGGQLHQLAAEHTSPRMLRSISYSASVNSAGKATGPSRQAQRKAAAAASCAAAAPPSAAAAPAAAATKSTNPRPLSPGAAARLAARERQKAAVLLGVPPETSCLGGSLVLHNVLARVPVASPFVVLRALTAALRRQAARLRRPGGVAPPPAQQQPARRSVGPLHLVYNFIRGIPFWIQQKRSRGSLLFDQDWKVLLVAASALDPTRLLQGRDFARLALRAKSAGVSLLPVLLTSELVPEQQEERARLALCAACGVDAAAVRVVVVDGALLQMQALQEAEEEGERGMAVEFAEQARAMAGRASGIADIQRQLQALLQEQQQNANSNMHFGHPQPSRSRQGHKQN